MPPGAHGPKFVPAGIIRARYAIAYNTLRSWEKAGKVKCLRNGEHGKRLYELAGVQRILGDDDGDGGGESEIPPQATQRILYARVATSAGAGDLRRQVDALVAAYPDHTDVVTDVGSGLDFKRKGLRSILDRVHGGLVHEVVVAHRDRLCRFGVELLEYVFKQNHVRLLVHDNDHGGGSGGGGGGDAIAIEPPDRRTEFSGNLIAITTAFVARHNGQRSAEKHRERLRTAATQKRKRKRKRKHDDAEGAEGEAGAEESTDASGAGGEGDAGATKPFPKRRAHAEGEEGPALPHA
jgi:putative resolvase